MKKPLAIAISLLMFLASTAPALAWGDDGHETIGKIASLRITQHTRQRLGSILKSGDTLANMATWADDVKDRIGEHDPDADTDAFLQDTAHNERNRDWHFVDLPLNCASYQACTDYQLPNDIVHLINVCIRTLQGQSDPQFPLTQRNALRLLIHFIGDLHQPLHVGVGFIEPTGPTTFRIARDPVFVSQHHLVHDRGGNQLIIDNDRKNLHGYWDFELVTSLMTVTHRSDSEQLGSFLKQTVAPQSNWTTQGPVSSWAEKWATDTLVLSRLQAYRSITIVRQRTVPVLRNGQPLVRDGQPVTTVVYDITRPANYLTVNRTNVRMQLAKGGFRLAKLLDKIFEN